MVRRRFALLGSDVRMRRSYRDILREVWQLARAGWARRGRARAARASAEWSRKLDEVETLRALIELLPPRHPLTRDERLSGDLLRRPHFVVVPVYFCMSGGQVADLGQRVHVGVPASALEPIRHTRDAAFVADRSRLLAEPTRVQILIHVMTQRSGVMQIARALGMSQPTVSEHVRVLARAGLIRVDERAGRKVYSASSSRVGRLVEDIGKTLARWA